MNGAGPAAGSRLVSPGHTTMGEPTSTASIPDQFNVVSHYVDRNLEEGRGERIALLYEDQRLSYLTVCRRINQTGNALRSLGVEVEDRVAMVLPSCPEVVYTMFGAFKIGAIATPMNPLLSPTEHCALLEDSRASVVVIGNALLPAFESIRHDLPHVRHIVVVGKSTAHRCFEDLVSAQSVTLDAAPTHRDDMEFWVYTSGTTGLPKAVVHRQVDLLHYIERYTKPLLGLRDTDRLLSLFPLCSALGCTLSALWPFAVGGTGILYTQGPAPERVIAAIQRYQATVLFGGPAAYTAIVRLAETDRSLGLPSVRRAESTGEPLPPQLYRRWRERFGIELLDSYGSSELFISALANREGAVRPGSCGSPVPGCEAKILDDEGREVPAGTSGILAVKAPGTCSGYWHRLDETRRRVQGEWFITGDRFHVDDDRYFWFEGRSDDRFRIGGRWVSPVEVERQALKHPAVQECALVPMQGEDGLTRPKLYIVLAPEHDPTRDVLDDLLDFLRWRVQRHEVPHVIQIVEQLPRTASGKIQRYRLREDIAAKGSSVP